MIYKATGVINFAQGGLLLFGAYLAYNFHNTWDFPFALAIIGAVAVTASVGALVERVILRRMVGQPVFAVIMITLGLLIIIEQVVTAIWGEAPRNMGDPWGIQRINLGDVGIEHKSLWTVGHHRGGARRVLRILPLQPVWHRDAGVRVRPGGGDRPGHQRPSGVRALLGDRRRSRDARRE